MAKPARATSAPSTPDPAPAPTPEPTAPAAPANYLQSLGMDTEAGTAFWKPTGRVQIVTLLSGRAPKPAEKVKVLPPEHGGDEVTVLAIFTVQKDGVDMTWEVTSRRAMAALAQVVTHFPVALAIQTRGDGKQTTYSVRLATEEEVAAKPAPRAAPAPAPEPAAAPRKVCEAPACVLYAGHTGRHMTQKEWRAKHGDAPSAVPDATTPTALPVA